MCIVLAVGSIKAQVVVKNGQDPYWIVETFLKHKEAQLQIIDVHFTGDNRAIGIFYSNIKSLPFQKGLLLSTGIAKEVDGPNESTQSGVGLFTRGNKKLNEIAGANTADAAVLEFVFYSASDSLEFEYFFASEEYPEYVDKGVNDVFALILEGQEYPEGINLAIIPGTNKALTVDNINHLRNKEHFVSNPLWQNDLLYSNVEKVELSHGFEFDGLTHSFLAKAKVSPFKPYKLTFAIADVGDNIYDSGVFVRANSIKNKGESMPFIQQIVQDVGVQLRDSLWLDFKASKDTLILLGDLKFNFDSYDVLPENFNALEELLALLKQYFTANVTIVGHTDAVGTHDYNNLLSLKRAESVKNYLINKGISNSRLKVEGKGKTAPLKIGANALNRRVAFILH